MKIFSFNRKMFIFLFGVMLLGVVFGSILPIFMSLSDKQLVSDYLSSFVSEVKSGIDCLFLFRNGIMCDCFLSFVIWILGISIIGIPIVVFLFFLKCFIFGFSISSIIINYGFKGILFSFIYVFPHHVINLLVYCFLTCFSLNFSFKLLGFIFKKHDFNIRNYFYRYFKLYIFLLVVLVLCVLYDAFINLYVFNFTFNLLGL